MLKAFIRWLWPQEAPRTQREPQEPYITRSILEREMEALEKRLTFDLDEWYEKFSTLHARTAKRQQREQQQSGVKGAAPAQPAPAQPSVLHHRKPWSV